MNTLMAGAAIRQKNRSTFTAAGYRDSVRMKEKRELYIAKYPAGSKQDELRDFNRAGYSQARPWHESPRPVFEFEAESGAAAVSAPVERRYKRQPRENWMDWLAEEARRDTKDVIICVVLCAMLVLMAALWGQRLAQSRSLQLDIQKYENGTTALEANNEVLRGQLSQAKAEDRIRNLAQNELGMLRPERAQTKEIYIPAADMARKTTVQENEEPKFEALDFMLGLLDVFGFEE